MFSGNPFSFQRHSLEYRCEWPLLARETRHTGPQPLQASPLPCVLDPVLGTEGDRHVCSPSGVGLDVDSPHGLFLLPLRWLFFLPKEVTVYQV